MKYFKVIPFEVLPAPTRKKRRRRRKRVLFIVVATNACLRMYVCTYEYEVQKVKAPIGSVRKRNIIFFGSNFLSYTFHF